MEWFIVLAPDSSGASVSSEVYGMLVVLILSCDPSASVDGSATAEVGVLLVVV